MSTRSTYPIGIIAGSKLQTSSGRFICTGIWMKGHEIHEYEIKRHFLDDRPAQLYLYSWASMKKKIEDKIITIV